MTLLRRFGIPLLIVLFALLSWDYANHPGRYHSMRIAAKVVPLQPDARMPTFRSVPTELDGKGPVADRSPAR